MPTDPAALAIDPGSAKCGIAAVRRSGSVLFRAVVPTETLLDETLHLIAIHAPVALVVGQGTGSRPLLKSLATAGLSIPIIPCDEAHTTELARSRYLVENPARGWQRLLPRGLRIPPVPVDDYVAVILAERYWAAQTS